MRIAVVGLGKIGLPLAVQFAGRGHAVMGVDIDNAVVDHVRRGEEPFPGESDLQRRLAEVVGTGLLTATTRTAAAVRDAAAVVVAVPLYVTEQGEPDFGPMDSAARAIAEGLSPGSLVSFETTLPIGTTRSRLVPLLESGSGLVAGEDFHVCFSPERVLTGRVFSDLRRYPKLVGGINAASEDAGVAFYQAVLEFDERPDLARGNGVWRMGSAEAAEFAKLAETTYRDVNIGLANQFATFAMKSGIDFNQVIEACNSQTYSHIHRPGIAVGGHCIPVYPQLYLWTDPDATVVRAARAVNTAMPSSLIDRLRNQVGSLEGLRVAVLGAAYRGGVKETAFSGVFPVVDALHRYGAVSLVHDPLFTDAELGELGLAHYERGAPVDAVVVQADHAEYATWGLIDTPGARTVVDGRGILDRDRWRGADMIVVGVG